jgi:hypothetical protein
MRVRRVRIMGSGLPENADKLALGEDVAAHD